jgi:putative phage-type endonuclease
VSTIVRVAQGSSEWHEHRRRYRNASETAAVMGLSPWRTPYQLWQLKLGLIEQEVTAAMRHGSEVEPAARAAFERQSGLIMQPLVVVDGEYSASCDGWTLAGDRVLEVKCPLNGCDSTLWKTVEAGRLPEHYQVQVQHQLMVTKAAVADVFVFDGADGVLLQVAPDPPFWPVIHEGWDKFCAFLASRTPPPLAKGDVRERSDLEWLAAAQAYVSAKATADEGLRALSEAKERLITLTSHTSESGGGVSVTRYWKTGPIDYKKIPELASVDLELYRGAARQETRVITA